MESRPVPSRTVLQVIRFAMLAGILLFGGVVYTLLSTGMMSPSGFDPDRSAVSIALSLAVLATGGSIPFMHRMIASADAAARRFQLTIVALALGEAAALIGGVRWLLTGSWTMYAVGVGIFLVALIWLSPETGSGDGP